MAIVAEHSIGRVWQEEGERNGVAFRFWNGTDLTLQIPLRMTYTTRPSQDLEAIDSLVEMDGLLARDCSKRTCSDGFECSLSPSGARVCCSYAQCSIGVTARAVCAAGCRRNERCEDISGQRWCCPVSETGLKCPRSTISNGMRCSPSSPFCPTGFVCEGSTEEADEYLCCMIEDFTIAPSPLTSTFPPFSTTTRNLNTWKRTATTRVPRCSDGSLSLKIDGVFLRCPEAGAPCPKLSTWICMYAITNNADLFVLC
uniref:GRANULINS domain-containing protein n=1 Tax=Heterorhabditis bacteriophora TaxID=37862 RepID=A0A1I7WL97_HETBA